MKVLIVFNHPAPYKVRIFNELAKYCDLTVIFEREVANDRPQSFYNIKEMNFEHYILKGGEIGRENSSNPELTRFIKKYHSEYDLIVMNGYSTFAEMRAINYLNKENIPFVLYINGGVIKKESKFKYFIKRQYISSAKWYLSPSVESSAYLYYYGAKPEQIYQYTYSSVEEKDILEVPLSKEEKDALRIKHNLPKGRLFICPTQFIERKNNMQLLECFKDAKADLLLIGSGEEKDKYLRYINENSMQNVHIFDYLDRATLFEIMRACDGCITLSKEDIFGHTINEAMANGLPVISSDKVVAALRTINKHNGVVVSLDNNEAIINAINTLDKRLAKGALESAKDNTIEKGVLEMVRMFKEVTK